MRIPTLYLKWAAFKAFIDDPSSNKQVAETVLYPGEVAAPEAGFEPRSKAASTFAKRLSGEVALEDETAEVLVGHMNKQLAGLRRRKSATSTANVNAAAPLAPADLARPTLAFAARLLEQWPDADKASLGRMHRALIDDLAVPASEESARLTVDRFDNTRGFGADAAPSGGSGPIVFEAGRHKGQVVILGEARVPLAAFTLFTRDPAPLGKYVWDLAWGEVVLWLPAPSVPILDDGRLLLMPQPEPVHATPGNFKVSTTLVWTPEALAELDPKTKSLRPDEAETAAFLSRLRSLHKYRRTKWPGAITILSADYIVKA